MIYADFLSALTPFCEAEFAAFQKKLILPPKQKILGVRTPMLRKLAKEYISELESVLAFPDEYYEITFIKLAMVAFLPYELFVRYLDKCVALIDNWALCDSFKNKQIIKHRAEFLSILEKYFAVGKEFYQRYVLVMLLSYYVEERYEAVLFSYLKRSDTSKYYVYMAASWLTAEILVKDYAFGIHILQSGILDAKTHNKSIQKAKESFRLSKQQKEFLNSLKIKQK